MSRLFMSRLRYSTAAKSGVRPQKSSALTSAPCASNSRATASWLFRSAINSGRMPFASASSTSAPAASSSSASFVRPSRAA